MPSHDALSGAFLFALVGTVGDVTWPTRLLACLVLGEVGDETWYVDGLMMMDRRVPVYVPSG